ncbi:hypothetical protein DH2020_020271 [Rehmannia glutinosa]|uniref:Integrase catalytic domain-containing protein n=1 Tax=Rehmannia glutinosa TaxID=99300 RepID=A0ABR0WFR6_REHGL
MGVRELFGRSYAIKETSYEKDLHPHLMTDMTGNDIKSEGNYGMRGSKGKETFVAPEGVVLTPSVPEGTPEGSLLNTPGVTPWSFADRFPRVNLSDEFAGETLHFTSGQWAIIISIVVLEARAQGNTLGRPLVEPLNCPEGVVQWGEEALGEGVMEEKWEEMLKKVCKFENSALLHRQLPADSIASFGEFSSTFMHQFISSRKHQKTSLTLFKVKQSEGKPLRDYVKKFAVATFEVPFANQEILTSALTQGFKEGDFFRSLAKRPAKDFDDVLSRAEKYVNLEEAQKGKKEENRYKRKERAEVHREVAQKWFREQERRPGLVPISGEPRLYTPLVGSRSRVLMAIGGNKDLKWPTNYSAVPSGPRRGRENARTGKEDHPPRGTINMIARGPTDGDSNRVRKAHARGEIRPVMEVGVVKEPIISFGAEDRRGISPAHNDTLVITTTMANFEVARIIVDTGNSVNVLFYEAFLRMGLEMEVKPVETVLFGFGSEVLEPIGQKSKRKEVESERETNPLKMTKRKEKEEPDMMSIKPEEELMSIELVVGDPIKVTRIRTQLGPYLANEIIGFLRENLDVFAWSSENWGGVDPKQDGSKSATFGALLVGDDASRARGRGMALACRQIFLGDRVWGRHSVNQSEEGRFRVGSKRRSPGRKIKAYHLSKITSSAADCSTRTITVLSDNTCLLGKEILVFNKEVDYRNDIRTYLTNAILPEEKIKASRIQARALGYCLIGGVLYKRAFSQPYLRCLSKEEGAYVLQELHEGACGSHGRSRLLAQKARKAGYFWPGLKEDAQKVVRTCEKCQKHGPLIHRPTELLGVMSCPCLFVKWGIDIVGPFPMALRQRKFLVVVVDYFSKWVLAEPLPKITEDNIMGFIWNYIVSRYGWPRDLVLDNGTQFQGRRIRGWLEGMKVKPHFTSVEHP